MKNSISQQHIENNKEKNYERVNFWSHELRKKKKNCNYKLWTEPLNFKFCERNFELETELYQHRLFPWRASSHSLYELKSSKLRVCANKPISRSTAAACGGVGKWLSTVVKVVDLKDWHRMAPYKWKISSEPAVKEIALLMSGGQDGQIGWRPRRSNRISVCRAAPSLRHLIKRPLGANDE